MLKVTRCTLRLVTSLADQALLLGSTMRLTRVVTSDDIGQWWVKDPLDAAFHKHEKTLLPHHKYLGGLECPHCVGFWVGAGVLASYVAARRRPTTLRAWRFLAATLTLNTVSTTVGTALDYWGGDDE